MSEAKKPERPLHLDVDFGEALARYAQTKPEEVEPPKGRSRKTPSVIQTAASRPSAKPKG